MRVVTIFCAAVMLVAAGVRAQGSFAAIAAMRNARIDHTATLLSDGRLLVAGGDDGRPGGNALSTAEIYDPATGKWTPTGSMLTGRVLHSATLLGDGRVLVIGGYYPASMSTAEIYDPAKGTWKAVVVTRPWTSLHTATLLRDGRVLVAGGDSSRVAMLFDPVTETWSGAGTMTAEHQGHTATRLADGRVLIAGGSGSTAVDIYTPNGAAGTWASAAALSQARVLHTATLLGDGRVLVAGGSDTLVSLTYPTSTEIFDPVSGTWSAGPSMLSGRGQATSSLLADGRVLIAGGQGPGALSSAEIYDPAGGGSFSSAGAMGVSRSAHTASLLLDGRVLIAGGYDQSALSSAEIYEPGPGRWDETGSMANGNGILPAGVLLADGRVLVIGSDDSVSAEIYTPATGSWTSAGAMPAPRRIFTATLLPSGMVLVAGGIDLDGNSLSSAMIFNPGTPAWTPVASMPVARSSHTATLLADGRVLIAGGLSSGQYVLPGAIYDPVSGQWTGTAPTQSGHLSHDAALLSDGRVLVAGGATAVTDLYDPPTNSWTQVAPLSSNSAIALTPLPDGRVLATGGATAELFDPATDSWTMTGTMAQARTRHGARLLADGRVLVVGGMTSNLTFTATAEIYDPARGLWRSAGTITYNREWPVTILLGDGRVLVAGSSSPAELYTPSSVSTTNRCPSIAAVRCPSITSASATIDFSSPLIVSGHFRSDAETSAGRGSQSSAANAPVVELISLQRGRKVTLRTLPQPPEASRPNFSDDPMTLAVDALPALEKGQYLLTVSVAGVRSEAQVVNVACGVTITAQPQNATAALGQTATFTVSARGARTYQWLKDGVTIPGATGTTYTTPPLAAADAGARYRAVVLGACASATTPEAAVTIADATPPAVNVISPSGGEYWLLSAADKPPNANVVVWSMSDNVRVCRVEASLLYSNDAGVSYTPVAGAGGGLPASFGSGGACAFPGESTSSLTYTVPASFPSGQSGSLYKVRIKVTDQAGNVTTRDSASPFYIVQPNPDSVKTLIVANVGRMIARQGISESDAAQLRVKLRELANHPRVQGLVVDLGSVTALASLYAAWDAEPSNPVKANDVLFGANGIQQYLRTNLLPAYTGVKYLILAGDDRIIPMARVQDHTVLLPEQSYPAGGDISPTHSTVGQALAGGKYLSDDPIAVLDAISTAQLDGSLFLPDLAVGRLVETPQQITRTIATYISQDGVLDLSLLDAAAGHKVLVTGYDFLSNVATQMRSRWKAVLGVTTPDSSLAPVDGSLVTGNWGVGSVAERTSALRARIAGNGGARYAVMAVAGHATHYEEGVPGTSAHDIQGLSTADLYGADACATPTPTAGAVDLAGAVVYAAGCHGGLSVPGSCRGDGDHSLDLPETMLARGAVAYVANSGYGWGLRYGIGYGSRLLQLFTEQLTSGGTIAVGDAVRQTKQRYYLETPRYDSYDEKSVMQWTLYGLPMYALKTGVAGQDVAATEDSPSGIRVTRQQVAMRTVSNALPPSLTQLSLAFDFTADGVYRKHDSSGTVLPSGPGCPDVNGCYYTLNGLVDRSTGAGDLPIQPYLIYDSRLSGSSQHGVLWKGGTYDEESGWNPVIAEMVSNGGDGSNHGSAPRVGMLPPTSLRIVPGVDSAQCRPGDLELNSLTITTGEAVKNQTSDLRYSIARRYRNVDLEVFYFNNQATPGQNCDRAGPAFGTGPFAGRYDQLASGTLSWAVPATDVSGVWRVLAVYTTNMVNAQGRGVWTPVELTGDGTGTFRGSVPVAAGVRLTYVLEAVDNRGNVTWLDFVAAQLPSSGVPPGVPRTTDVTGAPTDVVATSTSTTSVSVTWSAFAGAATYDVYRSASGTDFVKIGSTPSPAYQDATATAGKAYLYAVTALDGSGSATPRSQADLATTVMFDDAALAAGAVIRRIHVVQLRAAVDAVRTLAGIGAATYTDPAIAIGATAVRAAHLSELRSNLAAARATLGLSALTWSDPALIAGSTPVRAAHVLELRQGVQ